MDNLEQKQNTSDTQEDTAPVNTLSDGEIFLRFAGISIVLIIILLLLCMFLSHLKAKSEAKDTTEDCEACYGTGYYDAVICPICEGKGWIYKDENNLYERIEKIERM